MGASCTHREPSASFAASGVKTQAKYGRLFERLREDRDLDYHGDLRFYALANELGLTEERGSGLAEFRARFTRGDLEWIKPAAGE